MKALTVRQPWAWAIARGWKSVENRTWTTTYRGPLAIHAGAQWDDDPAWALHFIKIHARAQGATLPATPADDLPYAGIRCVVAVVDLVDICTRAMDGEPCDCGSWAMAGQAHWRLANPRLRHTPDVRGRLGLWDFEASPP